MSEQIAALAPLNCSKDYIQLSTEVFPDSKATYDKSDLALCAHIQPFQDIEDINNKLSHFGKH